jgi:PAS domain S-box-containing protein
MKPQPIAPVKFLLVDDLEENLLVLEKLLERPDLELLKASSGREALELLLKHEVALALVDVQMPEMDGFELAELMRGSERTRRVPVIFVTAGSRDQHRVFEGYDAGAVDFLFKPIDPQILRHKTQTFYELYRQRQELSHKLELLRESEELRSRIIEASHDFIGVLDRNGRLASVMGQGARLLSAPELESGAELDFSSLWALEDRDEVFAALERACAGELGRFVARRALMDDRYWHVAVSPIRDVHGTVEQILVVARDITDERMAQRDRERLNRELAETLRFNETFVAAIGHDLRNPLNAVVMATDILERSIPAGPATNLIQRIRSSSRRMAKMIDDLSDLTRARLGGGILIQCAPTDLLTVARKVVTEHRTTHPDRQIEIESIGELHGEWDSARLEQIVSNLVGNAIRHGDTGSPVHVLLDGADPKSVRFAVENGGQISSDMLPHLFEPFRRGNNRREGLGLGLYIVRQIAIAHGGDVVAESAERTRFVLRLPRSQAADGAAVLARS